jgi:asparagine synthase (glutamine-hydrolysing)
MSATDFFLGFHRLAIIDTSPDGNQPFSTPDVSLVCNGEIYNYHQLRSEFSDYSYTSQSDCEVIIPLFLNRGIEKTAQSLDAEFAFVLHDKGGDKFYAARDPLGIRPLFYGIPDHENNALAFASEAKALTPFCNQVKPFPPGHFYVGDGMGLPRFHPYNEITKQEPTNDDLPTILTNIRELLTEGVRKRLQSDVPIGFLLSGGLDSSLVCAIAARLSDKPITTFSVGIDTNPIDTKYAKQVAEYLGSDHHEVIFTEEEVKNTLDELIYHLETWDITTIRAAMGMYLVCKYIREKTDIRVVMTGEVSDELFGYKYTDFAPSAEEFQKEAVKRIDEIHLYDVLRADRSISAHGLEARVPFSDRDFVAYVMSIPGSVKMNTYGIEKALLRKAFEGDYLPHSILYRAKAAFSDAVGHRMVDYLKELAAERYPVERLFDPEQQVLLQKPRPFTLESKMYRDIFEKHFPGHSSLIPAFWMPNKNWKNCDVDDPSARVLPNYGDSGS